MHPIFLDGPSGKLFSAIYPSESPKGSSSWVLFVPPFAEELNKCRPMVSLQARDLASKGHNVLVADLFGSGDSEGGFSQADWSVWKQDLCFLAQWVRDQGAKSLSLWGIRTGCLLAADVLNNLEQSGPGFVQTLVLWQPVVSGETFLKQFLRLKVAAAMMEGEKLAVNDLLTASKQGEVVEVAGYELSPSLIEQLTAVSMKKLEIPNGTTVHWMEVAASDRKSLSPAAKGVTAQWQEAGINISTSVIPGEPFWSTQEIAMAPDVVSATSGVLGNGSDDVCQTAISQSVTFSECPMTFQCRGEQLVGVLHKAALATGEQSASQQTGSAKGVLLVVGGPQYRVGSHRQFVLLARHLAKEGIPVFRFDYRGMGDSSGQLLGFENIQDDIAAAMDCFQQQLPELDKFVIWGLCDAATAASFYASVDSRVKGLVLLNPWAYSEQGEAKAFLKHYYLQRLFSKSFWLKVLRGEFRPKESLGSLSENLGKAQAGGAEESEKEQVNSQGSNEPLGDRIQAGLKKFTDRALIVLSGRDLTAAQFRDVVNDSSRFKRLLKQSRFSVREMPGSDHTFSSAEDRAKVEKETLEWLRSW